MDRFFNLLNADGDVITRAVGDYRSVSITGFVGKTIDGQVVASLEDATPPEVTEENERQEANAEALNSLAERLADIHALIDDLTARVTTLEDR